MTDRTDHITYSFEDIRRYLKGKLSTAEMHALEKAALQDPFLAEAIEGYEAADLSTTQADLAEIQYRLQNREEDVHPAPVIPTSHTFWLRSWPKIAAIILLIAGAGTVTWKLLSDQPAQPADLQTVAVKKEPAPEDKPTTVKINSQTGNSVKNSVASNTKKSIAPVTIAVAEDTEAENTIAGTNRDEARTMATPTQSAKLAARMRDTFPLDPNLSSQNGLVPEMALQGKVAGVMVETSPQKKKRLEEQRRSNMDAIALKKKAGPDSMVIALAGNLPLPNKAFTTVGSLSETAISSQGKIVVRGNASRHGQGKTSSADSVNDAAILKEVVITTLGTKHQKSVSGAVVSTAAENTGKEKPFSALAQLQNGVYPSVGWTVFNEELRGKIRRFKKDSLVVFGEIEVAMELDTKGKVTNANILRSYDPSLNGLVVDAVKQHLHWVQPADKKSRKITVTIRL